VRLPSSFNDISVEDLLIKLPDGTPAIVKPRLREALIPRVDARTLPRADGKILVTDLKDRAWSSLDAKQLTTQPVDIDPALAEFLADTVASISPDVAENVAKRAYQADEQRPLINLLGCRLQAQVDAKRVTLRADTIEKLRNATGPCGASP
jgi:hypothetical protein